jgi:hypothetical protein
MMRRFLAIAVALAVSAGCGRGQAPRKLSANDVMTPAKAAVGPLRVSTDNPRYFATPAGDIVYLTGSHTWNNLQDWGSTNPPPFNYISYLDFLIAHGHNFMRMHAREQTGWMPWSAERVWVAPLPYEQTGPGTALDGEQKFNLTRWNDQFFSRLRSRVLQAGPRGVYVSVMLFNGFSVTAKVGTMPAAVLARGTGNPWKGHPFNGANNVNAVDGDSNRNGKGEELHTLSNPALTALQRAFVAKVIESVGDLENVLREISNESLPGSRHWQYAMAKYISGIEAAPGNVHPIGISVESPHGDNRMPFESAAAWVSVNEGPAQEYRSDPLDAKGRKVVMADTDHVWRIGGTETWVWRASFAG